MHESVFQGKSSDEELDLFVTADISFPLPKQVIECNDVAPVFQQAFREAPHGSTRNHHQQKNSLRSRDHCASIEAAISSSFVHAPNSVVAIPTLMYSNRSRTR